MFKILSHQGSTNQNHIEIPSPQNRMTVIIIKKTNKYCQESVDKGTHVYYWRGCKLVHPLSKSRWKFSRKPKLELLLDTNMPFQNTYSQNNKRHIIPQIPAPMSFGGLLTIAKLCNQFMYLSVGEWIKKYACTQWDNQLLKK